MRTGSPASISSTIVRMDARANRAIAAGPRFAERLTPGSAASLVRRASRRLECGNTQPSEGRVREPDDHRLGVDGTGTTAAEAFNRGRRQPNKKFFQAQERRSVECGT